MGQPGPQGPSGPPQNQAPAPAKETAPAQLSINAAQLGDYTSILLARILLFKAELDYYAARTVTKDDPGIQRACNSLVFLAQICGGNTQGTKIPAQGSPGYPYATQQAITANDWLALQNKASILLGQMARGLDFYGNAFNYSPRLSFDSFDTILSDDYFTTLATIDDAYNKYISEIAKETDQIQQINAGIDGYQATNGKLVNQIRDKVTDFNSLQADIAFLNQQIVTLMNDLKDADKKFAQNVTSYINAHDGKCDYGTSLGIMGSIITGTGDFLSLGKSPSPASIAKVVTTGLGAVDLSRRLTD